MLALNGGERAVTLNDKEASRWPIITEEEVNAVTDLLKRDEISFSEEPYKFEEEFSRYLRSKYALMCNNGTAAIHSAFFAAGVGPGDEVIAPSLTFWATVMPILSCNAVPVFCEVDPETCCIDPEDVERRITPQTKAIIVVHLFGMPAEMDEMMDIARDHDIVVIEDASHAHGAEYKGRKIGSIGDMGCFSLQASKMMVAGEGGVLVTNNREYYERAVALGHYERLPNLPSDSKYRKHHMAHFGYKYRIHPLAAAIARVQLKYLDERNKERNANMEYLSLNLKDMKGIEIFDTPPYAKRTYWQYEIRYCSDELKGLPRSKFIEALRAEGVRISPERYEPLHLQPIFEERNIHGRGCPFDCPHVKRKIVYEEADLPITEKLQRRLLALPAFPRAKRELLDQYVEAFKKVTMNFEELL